MSHETPSSPSDSFLSDLYQEVILEHTKRPRFRSKPLDCQFCQEGKNPLCGDSIRVFCHVEGNGAESKLSLHFEGHGCSISQASASMMCDAVQQKSLPDTRKLIAYAESIYTGKTPVHEEDLSEDIEALSGVSKFPVRIKCAALPWKTLEILIEDNFDAAGNHGHGCDKLKNCVENNTKKLKIVNI